MQVIFTVDSVIWKLVRAPPFMAHNPNDSIHGRKSAPVVELVDTYDSGSYAKSMGVRVSPGAPL